MSIADISLQEIHCAAPFRVQNGFIFLLPSYTVVISKSDDTNSVKKCIWCSSLWHNCSIKLLVLTQSGRQNDKILWRAVHCWKSSKQRIFACLANHCRVFDDFYSPSFASVFKVGCSSFWWCLGTLQFWSNAWPCACTLKIVKSLSS